jgi:predicted  nucleic acid-binding Zn-ribbon protein
MPKEGDSGSSNGDDDDRSMSTKLGDMEDRIDVQDEEIRALREDLETQIDVLDSRIREIESGAADVETARKLFEYILALEEQISTLKGRLEAAIDEGPED